MAPRTVKLINPGETLPAWKLLRLLSSPVCRRRVPALVPDWFALQVVCPVEVWSLMCSVETGLRHPAAAQGKVAGC